VHHARSVSRTRLPPPLRHRDFGLLWVALVAMTFAGQMVLVAVGWQVYDIDENPFDLGLIGLAEFLPLLVLALPAGHLADHFSRKVVFAWSLALHTAVVALLLVVSLTAADRLWPFLLLAGLAGVASAIGSPAGRALPPALVPQEMLASAMALRSTGSQAAVVVGPAVGGLLFAISPELVYGVAVVLSLVGLACTLALHERGVARAEVLEPPPRLEAVFAGVRFVMRTPVLLGAIALDLFAVLFGGAVALLPLFAKSVLHVGPVGLGVLRSTPAVGAIVAGIILTHKPLRGNIGRTMLVTVGIFGVSMVVFGLSKSFALSAVALAVSGFTDMISVNIRATVVPMATPDELLGRVNAVEWMFISASNELGAFESGAAAALIGAVPAVVIGGCATIAIALVWTKLFPALAQADRFEDLRPQPG
jgi:MFS family permease